MSWLERTRRVITEQQRVFHVVDEEWSTFFDAVSVALSADPKLLVLASNYITSDLVGLRKADSTLILPEPVAFAELIRMVADGELSSRGTKNILSFLVKEGGEPHIIAERENLLQVHDESALIVIIEKVIATNPVVVSEFRGGKEQALQFLVGAAMRESKGSANPEKLGQLFREKLTHS